jgi:hypothetical protein
MSLRRTDSSISRCRIIVQLAGLAQLANVFIVSRQEEKVHRRKSGQQKVQIGWCFKMDANTRPAESKKGRKR